MAQRLKSLLNSRNKIKPTPLAIYDQLAFECISIIHAKPAQQDRNF
jgi:hypothetical protein